MSQTGYEKSKSVAKSEIFVLNRARVYMSVPHLPTRASADYPPLDTPIHTGTLGSTAVHHSHLTVGELVNNIHTLYIQKH